MGEFKTKVYGSPFTHHEVKTNHIPKTNIDGKDTFSHREGEGNE